MWIRPFRDIVYVMPPFVASSDEIAQLTTAIVDVVEAWSSR